MERGLEAPLSPNEETTLRLVAKGFPDRMSYRSRDIHHLIQLKKNSKQFLRMEEPVRHAAFMAQIVDDLIIQAEEDGCVELEKGRAWYVLRLSGIRLRNSPRGAAQISPGVRTD
jgi:hypothetical protein